MKARRGAWGGKADDGRAERRHVRLGSGKPVASILRLKHTSQMKTLRYSMALLVATNGVQSETSSDQYATSGTAKWVQWASFRAFGKCRRPTLQASVGRSERRAITNQPATSMRPAGRPVGPMGEFLGIREMPSAHPTSLGWSRRTKFNDKPASDQYATSGMAKWVQ